MMKFHPLADLFPLIEGAEFAELVADIKANGLRVPIVTIEGEAGPVILDGRNRYRACVEACVEPRFETYQGDDPAGFVVSINLKRRHMTESQRSIVGARLSNIRVGDFVGNQHEGSANLPTPAVSQADAAKMLNVSDRSVRTARTVLDKGTPALVKKVESGELAVSAAAKVAKASKETQDVVAKLPPEKVKTAVKALDADPSLGFTPSPKLLAKMEELEDAEAKAKEARKSLPSKQEALAISKAQGGFVRANDGKDYIHVDPADDRKLDVWFWFKPTVDTLRNPKYSPAEVADSIDDFWIGQMPSLIDGAVSYLYQLKSELEARHGAAQIAAE